MTSVLLEGSRGTSTHTSFEWELGKELTGKNMEEMTLPNPGEVHNQLGAPDI